MKTENFTSKFLLRIAFILLAFFTIASCSNDDDETPSPIVYAEENPLSGYLAGADFTTTTSFVNSGSYEFGFYFSPNVKGKIKALKAKLPDVNSSLKVTIWDYTTHAVLRTEIMNVATASTEITMNISELALEKDKQYMITMNSNDWYNHKKASGANATYPITSGNIKILGYGYKTGATQTFPDLFYQDYYAGDLSFVFQQTE